MVYFIINSKIKKKSLNSLKDFTSALPFKRELKSRVLLKLNESFFCKHPCFHHFLVTYLHQSFADPENNYRRIGWGLINLFAGRGEGVRDQFSVIHH